MELKIEYLSKNDLKPYANNAKIHTAEQIEQIKKSIREFGFNDPIAVWHDNEIVEGHGRLLAAMEMDDVDIVPVIRLDNLTDEERRAYALAHNFLSMKTGFSLDVLRDELKHIEQLDMSVYGFDDIDEVDIDDLFQDNPFDVDEDSEDGKHVDFLDEEKDDDKDGVMVDCPYCGEKVVIE